MPRVQRLRRPARLQRRRGQLARLLGPVDHGGHRRGRRRVRRLSAALRTPTVAVVACAVCATAIVAANLALASPTLAPPTLHASAVTSATDPFAAATVAFAATAFAAARGAQMLRERRPGPE